MAGEEGFSGDALGEGGKERFKKLLLFSGNDYLGLSSHPTIANAAASVCFQNVFKSTNLCFFHCLMVLSSTQAVQEYGMGPKGSALICGYTNYHRLLESSLAELKKKEVKTKH